MNRNELMSLIALLEDPDEEIHRHVVQKLELLGGTIIPELEEAWHRIHDLEHQQRIEDVIHSIQFQTVQSDLIQWFKSAEHDLLEGACIIARYRYPHVTKASISAQLDALYLDIWLEQRPQYPALDKIRVFNEVFYQVHGFHGNTEHYHDPQNSCINQVLESKKGNPIMLSIIYMLLCRRLKMPVFGVNLPQHFILVYKENGREEELLTPGFSDKSKEFGPAKGIPLFYINAFTYGNVFTKPSIESFLKQIHIEPRMEYYEPCSHVDIIKRVIRNLAVSYEKQHMPSKQKDMMHLLFLLGEAPISGMDLFESGNTHEE